VAIKPPKSHTLKRKRTRTLHDCFLTTTAASSRQATSSSTTIGTTTISSNCSTIHVSSSENPIPATVEVQSSSSNQNNKRRAIESLRSFRRSFHSLQYEAAPVGLEKVWEDITSTGTSDANTDREDFELEVMPSDDDDSEDHEHSAVCVAKITPVWRTELRNFLSRVIEQLPASTLIRDEDVLLVVRQQCPGARIYDNDVIDFSA
jgi:hypothetical protein